MDPIEVGDHFGTWKVIRESHRDSNGRRRWVLRCECGNEHLALESQVRAAVKCHVCQDGPIPPHLRS